MNQLSPQNTFEQTPGVIRDKGRFAAGSSGNPGGRPKIVGHVQDLCRAHTDAAIAALCEIMADADAPAAARVAAAANLLDRAWGKPRQAIEISTEDGADARAERLLAIFESAARMSNDGARDFVAIASGAPSSLGERG